MRARLEFSSVIPIYGANSTDDFAPIDFTPAGQPYAPAMMGTFSG